MSMQSGTRSALEMVKCMKNLSPDNTALFLCDMQEKFRKLIFHFDDVIASSSRMLHFASIMAMPIIATEQYPKGLGRTVADLDLAKFSVPIFEKTCFSMLIDEVEKRLKSTHPGVDSILLCGIETHACIYQTCVDLLLKNYSVHVIVDACSSRTQVDRLFALRALEKMGANLTTSECAMFSLMKDASHPKFKEVQKLIVEPSSGSGLLKSLL